MTTTTAPATTPDSAPSTTTRSSDGQVAGGPPDPTASLWSLRNLEAHARFATSRLGATSWGSVLSTTGLNAPLQPQTQDPLAGQVSAPTRFEVLQKWEGIVLDVSGNSFAARLIDLIGNEPDQEAEFPIRELSPRDRKRLIPGALFYWYIGYRDDLSGDRDRSSRLRFRRLPPPSEPEVERARQAAKKLRSALGWHRR